MKKPKPVRCWAVVMDQSGSVRAVFRTRIAAQWKVNEYPEGWVRIVRGSFTFIPDTPKKRRAKR